MPLQLRRWGHAASGMTPGPPSPGRAFPTNIPNPDPLIESRQDGCAKCPLWNMPEGSTKYNDFEKIDDAFVWECRPMRPFSVFSVRTSAKWGKGGYTRILERNWLPDGER